MGHRTKTSVEFIYTSLWVPSHSSPLGQERWCVRQDCCLLKSVLIPSLCLSSLIKAWSSLIWVILTIIPLDVARSHLSSGDTSVIWQLTSYRPHHWLFSHRTTSLGSKLWTSLSSHITHQVHPGPWAKAIHGWVCHCLTQE